MEEGCLSIPDIRSEIERPKRVTIKFYDTNLKEQRIEASELLARVIQHEYDHLQGVLFIDRISGEDNKKLKKELNKIKQRKRDFDYPVTEHMDYQLL